MSDPAATLARELCREPDGLIMNRRDQSAEDRHDGADPSPASAVVLPRVEPARQRRHDADPAAAPGRVAASLKRPRQTWARSGEMPFRAGELA
ncbi:hypothetical protein [Nonomuraea basaltis]|uniref:hypothetical protein n=1 Tax=Nonomuraea basaltis TaxID=2495887 RepID=UPI00110C5A0F|nr:hypothetical protein [Nonomuraea basaltis]TMR91302.1 hypothetical protein EJK15_50825 [Nonomuraea basaltis]